MSSTNRKFVLLLAATAVAGSACTNGPATSEIDAGRAGRAAYEELASTLEQSGVDAADARFQELSSGFDQPDQNGFLELARGRILDARGSHEAAMAAYMHATELDAGLSEAHYFLSAALLNAFDYEQALVAAERAVDLDPENEDYLYIAAQLYDRTDRHQQAEETWKSLLELAPGEPRYLVPLAGLYHRRGEIPRAIELLDRAGEGDDSMAMVGRQLAAQLRGQLDTYAQLQRLDASIKFAPDDPTLYRRRAELLLETDSSTAAEEAVRQAILLDPGDAADHFLLGQILDKQGNKAGAVAEVLRAVELEPDNVSYRLSLGGLQWQTRDIEGARASLEMVIEMAPDSDEAEFAREQLLRMGR